MQNFISTFYSVNSVTFLLILLLPQHQRPRIPLSDKRVGDTKTPPSTLIVATKRKNDGTDSVPDELCGVIMDYVDNEMDTSPDDIIVCRCAWSKELCNLYIGSHPLLTCVEDGCNERVHLECQASWENSSSYVDNGGNGVYCPTHHPFYIDALLDMFDGNSHTSWNIPSLPPFPDTETASPPAVKAPTLPAKKKKKRGPCTSYTQWWDAILQLEQLGAVDLRPLTGINPKSKLPFRTEPTYYMHSMQRWNRHIRWHSKLARTFSTILLE